MSQILTSVQRLCALARVGSVRLDRTMLASFGHLTANAPAESMSDAVTNGVAIVRDALAAHGITRIDIDTTATDTEFVKLAGLLNLENDPDGEALREAARDLGLWNMRLWFDGDAAPIVGVDVRGLAGSYETLTPGASDSAPRATQQATQQAEEAARARGAAVAAVESGELDRALSVQDAATVCRVLHDAIGTSAFATGATAVALHLVVEALVTEQYDYASAFAVLEHAGVSGTRAVVAQLMAANDLHERRLLFDVGASLPSIVVVARENISNATWYVVRNAAALLGESKQNSAIDDLSRLLKHIDTRVRVAAVVALGKIGGQAAMARLESVLFDPSVDVRNRALSIVFAAPDSEPVPSAVMGVLDEEVTLEFQLEMIAALAHVHTARARARLTALCEQDGQSLDVLQVRLAAVGALATGHRPAADAVLNRLRGDPSALIRDRVQTVLG
ncbi:MAG: HEAT repeat domain-containing protein [Gemmatimonadaceae bacterium]|nr:HEAT repeat domain-containing protein [Gemmatimonadaceae bacterium]